MKDSGYATNYITEFRTLMTKVSGWGDKAFFFHFRQGLPARLLDQLAGYDGPQETLQDLMDIVLKYDTCYHERIWEKSFTLPQTSRPGPSLPNPQKSQQTSQPGRFKGKTKPTPTNSTPTYVPNPNVGEDGHLKAEEKARPEREGLCNYCGGTHKISLCRKRPDFKPGQKPNPMKPKQGKD